MNQPLKVPGPDHPVTLQREPARVRVLFGGHLLGESTDVIMLREAGYPPVRYFPRQDIEMSFLRKTAKTSYCPYKGEAGYFTLYRDGEVVEDTIWSYEQPHPTMAQLAGRLAFYPENVEFEVEALDNGDIGKVIRHTESGAGSSQEAPWPPNARNPDAARCAAVSGGGVDIGLKTPAHLEPSPG